MTKDQFTLYASALIRHLLTLGAGLLAARGMLASNDMVSNLIAAAAVFIATLSWSFIQKNKLLQALCAAIQPSEIEALLALANQIKPPVVQPPSAAAPSTAAPAPGAQLSPAPEPDAAEIPLTEEVTHP